MRDRVVGDFIGLPYRSGGRDLDGVDCWGLALLVSREVFGRELPEYSYRSADERAPVAAAIAAARPEYDEVVAPSAGDLVLFRIDGVPRHVGVMVSGWEFIHTLRGRESCIELVGSAVWRRRVVGYFRPRSAT